MGACHFFFFFWNQLVTASRPGCECMFCLSLYPNACISFASYFCCSVLAWVISYNVVLCRSTGTQMAHKNHTKVMTRHGRRESVGTFPPRFVMKIERCSMRRDMRQRTIKVHAALISLSRSEYFWHAWSRKMFTTRRSTPRFSGQFCKSV